MGDPVGTREPNGGQRNPIGDNGTQWGTKESYGGQWNPMGSPEGPENPMRTKEP